MVDIYQLVYLECNVYEKVWTFSFYDYFPDAAPLSYYIQTGNG